MCEQHPTTLAQGLATLATRVPRLCHASEWRSPAFVFNLQFAFCNSQFAMSPPLSPPSVVSCSVCTKLFSVTQLVFDALLIGYFSAK